MTKILIRGAAAIVIAGLAAFTPTVAHAAVAGAQETQPFTGWAYENSPNEAKQEAEKMARQRALISGFTNEQCVLLYANSYRLAPGYYSANAAISCTR
ncbi:hypothetical protein AB0B78_23975 [Streptomyces sp. NPDC040724]|uniref:hypothetical protein n=1 Tax=unclassified Streptomyces TaxID=2593676 RepID=UPI0033E72BEF